MNITITDSDIIDGVLSSELNLQGAQEINFDRCSTLTVFPHIPEGVENVRLLACNGLENINNMGFGAQSISFWNCDNLINVRNIPEGVKDIDFQSCGELIEVGEIPESILNVNFFECKKFRKMCNIIHTAHQVKIFRCEQFQVTSEIFHNFFVLRSEGCQIFFPELTSWLNKIAEVQSRLENICQEYEIDVSGPQNQLDPLRLLLQRFLTENIMERGGLDVILQEARVVLDVLDTSQIKGNDKYLKILAESAEIFLAGCINQPVSGLSEISALASIMVEPTILGKIESAKNLLFLDEISKYVIHNFHHEEVEIEAGNILLRESYVLMQRDNILPKCWPGIPGPIAYEETIGNWLGEIVEDGLEGETNLSKFYRESITVLQKSVHEIAEIISKNTHCEIFGKICFPQELSDIYKSQNEEKNILLESFEASMKEDRDNYEELTESYTKDRVELDNHHTATVKELVSNLVLAAIESELQDSIKTEISPRSAENVVQSSAKRAHSEISDNKGNDGR